MYEVLQRAVQQAHSLDEIGACVIPVLLNAKNRDPHRRLGYVSGIISSDGPEKMPENIRLLHERTEKIARLEKFPVFGPTYIFTDSVYGNIDAENLTSDDWNNFWASVLIGIADKMYMTERWQCSKGAQFEFQLAYAHDIEVCFHRD